MSGNILDDIIFNESKELKKQLDKYHLELEQHKKLLGKKTLENIKDKENILLQNYNKKSIVYLILINGILYKFGWSNDIIYRLKTHKKEIGENITLIYCIESKNNILLEHNLKDYLQNTIYRKNQVFNDKNQTELIEIDDVSIIQNKLEKLNKTIYEDKELLKYKMKILELENENLKLKIDYNHQEIQQESKEEIQQESKEQESKEQESKEQESKETKNKKQQLEKRREYYKNNKEQFIKSNKKYHEKNKKQILEQKREHYEKNKKQILEQKKEYREKNKKQIVEKKKEYREKNKKQILE